MTLFERDPELDIGAASGVLRVTLRPRFQWFALLFEIAIILVLATFAYRGWAKMAFMFRAFWVWGLHPPRLLSFTNSPARNPSNLTRKN